MAEKTYIIEQRAQKQIHVYMDDSWITGSICTSRGKGRLRNKSIGTTG